MLKSDSSLSDRNTIVRTASPLGKALAGLAALAVAMGIGRFAFTPILPMMQADAGLSIAAGGLLASANYLGYLLGALSATFVRVAPERAIRTGLLAVGVVTLAMSLPLPFSIWLLLRLLAGVASAWLLISVSAWGLEALAAYQRPFLNSLVFAGVGTGIATAGLVCLALNESTSSQAWAALGGLALAVTALVWRVFGRTHAAAGTKPSEHARYRWDAQSARMVLCYGVTGFGYIIPATFLPVMAKNALHGSPLFGWSWPVFGLAAALSTLVVAPLVKRAGNRRLWIVSHFIMAFGILLPAIWPGLLAIMLAALCVGGTFMVVTLTALQEARRTAGRNATVLIAAMTSSFAAGQIIGPLTVSAGLGGNSSFSLALVVAAAMLAASALLLMTGKTTEQP